MWLKLIVARGKRFEAGRLAKALRSAGAAALIAALLLPSALMARSQPAGQEPGKPVTRKKSLKYDAVSRVKEQLTQLLDASGKQVSAIRESFDYDGRGNRKTLTVEELDANNAVQRSFTEVSNFDALGRESEMVHTDFKNGVKLGGGKVTHKFDPVGQETETTDELLDAKGNKVKGRRITRKFDPVGSVIEQMTELSDKEKRISAIKETMKYNPVRSEIEHVTAELDKDDKPLRSVKVSRKYNAIRQEIERTTQSFDAQGKEVSSKTETIDPKKGADGEDPDPAL